MEFDIAEDIEVGPGGSITFNEDLDIEEDEEVGVLEEDPFNKKLEETRHK